MYANSTLFITCSVLASGQILSNITSIGITSAVGEACSTATSGAAGVCSAAASGASGAVSNVTSAVSGAASTLTYVVGGYGSTGASETVTGTASSETGIILCCGD